MATTIKIKNSVTATTTPTSLVQGEVAINVTDKKVWVGNAATTPIQIVGAGTTGNAAGSNTQVQYNSSGSFAGDADFTFNGTTVTMANDASISGLTVGKGAGSVSNNTVVGVALYNNTTGSTNSAFGTFASAANTTGSTNNSFGYAALGSTTTGSNNAGFGGYALTSNTTGGTNTAVGVQSLNSNTTASNNTAVGYQVAYSNTTGTNNSALGTVALYANTTGGNNVAIGQESLRFNTTASNNTAVGYQAGYTNTTGASNTLLGQTAGYANSTGSGLVAVGFEALRNTTASDNTAVGVYAMKTNTTGQYNTALGGGQFGSNWGALGYNTTGSNNTAVGFMALLSNTTASNNTAVGYQAGYSNTTGNMVAVGKGAGYTQTTATSCTYVGTNAGYLNSTGANNTFVGDTSGYNTTGGNNTFIGIDSGYLITSGAKNTIVGKYNGNNGGLDIRTASNYIVLSDGDGNPRGWFDNNGTYNINQGNNAQTTVLRNSNASFSGNAVQINIDRNTTNGSFYAMLYYNIGASASKFIVLDSGNVQNTNGSYGTISDAKLKENIVDATSKLDKVNQLQVRNYNLIGDDLKQIGFVAQEFEQVFPSMVENIFDRDKDGNDLGTTTKTIKTTVLIPILVKAIQELNAKIEAQALEIATLKGN